MSSWSAEFVPVLQGRGVSLLWTQLWDPARVELERDALAADERQTMEQFRNETARARYLQGRWMVRKMFAQLLDCEPADVPIEVDRNGRPHCPETVTPDFNLSHTANSVAVAFCATHSVGIDVEHTQRRVNRVGIQKRFFAREEQDWVEAGGQDAFFELWTRKEAMLKASGEGLRGNWGSRSTVNASGGDADGWSFHTFRICDQVLATVACAPEAGRVHVYHLNAADELEPHQDAS